MEVLSVIASRLILALAVGGLIGMERALHGRPAGIRTHALVSMAAALLMLLTVYPWDLMGNVPIESIRIDPTRMAQGIMTGIGFLGAGVIMKDKLTIRGLTTAASIWTTSSVGIMIGTGFYTAALVAALLTVLVLSLFRWLEARLPVRRYAKMAVRMQAERALSEADVVELLQASGVRNYPASYALEPNRRLSLTMTIYSSSDNSLRELAWVLTNHPQVLEFSLTPTGD